MIWQPQMFFSQKEIVISQYFDIFRAINNNLQDRCVGSRLIVYDMHKVEDVSRYMHHIYL